MSNVLEAIAAITGHPVPDALVARLQSYPAELSAMAEAMGFAPHECFLYPDLETVRAANAEVRDEDIWTEEGPWPAGFLDIGADLGGDRFALALTEVPPRVYRLNHDVGQFVLLAGSLEDYVAGLIRLARREAKTFAQAFPRIEASANGHMP